MCWGFPSPRAQAPPMLKYLGEGFDMSHKWCLPMMRRYFQKQFRIIFQIIFKNAIILQNQYHDIPPNSFAHSQQIFLSEQEHTLFSTVLALNMVKCVSSFFYKVDMMRKWKPDSFLNPGLHCSITQPNSLIFADSKRFVKRNPAKPLCVELARKIAQCIESTQKLKTRSFTWLQFFCWTPDCGSDQSECNANLELWSVSFSQKITMAIRACRKLFFRPAAKFLVWNPHNVQAFQKTLTHIRSFQVSPPSFCDT